MNYSTAIFLVNPHVRCVAVSYDRTFNSSGKELPSSITSYKTLDASIAVDDLVVIPTDTRYGYTIGKVTKVNCDVDHDSPQQMRWIVGRMDPKFIDDIIAQEEQVIGRVRAAEDKSKRDELAAKLNALNPDFANIHLIDMTPVQEKTTYEPEPEKRGGAQEGVKPAT